MADTSVISYLVALVVIGHSSRMQKDHYRLPSVVLSHYVRQLPFLEFVAHDPVPQVRPSQVLLLELITYVEYSSLKNMRV